MIPHKVVHESQIAPGNSVRVVGGRDIHRTGHVLEIIGSMVRIRETAGIDVSFIPSLSAHADEYQVLRRHQPT